MPDIFITSDNHWDHKNIIEYSQRPFFSIEEMNETMLDRLNERVRENDILYHLGDVSLGKKREDIERWVKRFRVKKSNRILVLGNHDRLLRDHKTWALELFDRVYPSYAEVKVENLPVTLSHYALRVWNKSHHGAFHLYGHSHGSLPDDPHSLSFDVGVDCHDFYPLSWDEVKQKMAKKEWKAVDHHGRH